VTRASVKYPFSSFDKMASPDRKRGRKKDPALARRRCDQILKVAARHFARKGFQDTDLDQVADELGVAKGTLYRYFPSKQKLFLAAVDRGMVLLKEFVRARYQHVADPLVRLKKAIRGYLEFFKRNPDQAELLILERAVFRNRLKPTYFTHREANSQDWKVVYADMIRQGRLRDMPVERIMDVIHNLVYGTMFTNHFARQHKSLDRQTEDIVDVLFHGIVPSKGSSV
jgi:AcrR family transcriptional regulator